MKKKQRKFSAFWFFILVLSVIWFLNEAGIDLGIDIPWLPLIMIIIALGFFINKLLGR